MQAATLEAEGRTIRVERRSDEQGPYLWGSDTRTKEEYATHSKDAPDASPGSDRPYGPGVVSSSSEFMVSEKGDELFANLAELRALRTMGKIDEDKHALYELHEKTHTVTVIHDGGSRSLRVGGKIFGGTDRYALDPSTGEGYVISEVVTRDFLNGETGLRLSKVHAYDQDEVGKAVIEAKGQKRTMLRILAMDDRGNERRTWADAQTPNKPDQTMANFLRNIDVLRPARFIPDADISKLQRVLRVEYQTRVGAPLGWIELYQQPHPDSDDAGAPGQQPAQTPDAPAAPAAPGQRAAPGRPGGQEQERRQVYLLRTEVARVLAGVPHNMAARIVADVDQIFGHGSEQ
jgi:hypothetical protein